MSAGRRGRDRERGRIGTYVRVAEVVQDGVRQPAIWPGFDEDENITLWRQKMLKLCVPPPHPPPLPSSSGGERAKLCQPAQATVPP